MNKDLEIAIITITKALSKTKMAPIRQREYILQLAGHLGCESYVFNKLSDKGVIGWESEVINRSIY